ncbi:MAG TPA: serine--tRNA ligase [Longimicrobiales bacterium]|jgi:seryl-tRNA synthetase
MLDIRQVREDPASVKAALRKRGDDPSNLVDELLSLDGTRRASITEVNELKARRNEVSREIGERKKAGADADSMIADMRLLGEDIARLDALAGEAERRQAEILLSLPNLPLDEVPAGGEQNNLVVKEWGERRAFSFAPRPHWELGEDLAILDLFRGSRISGSGFPVLAGDGARLQRCLIHHFLERHTTRNGYRELRVPYLVTSETLTGTGQLPKFSDESYRVERDDLWLIPTAEVPVTNLHGGEILSSDDLPIRYTAYSPCFRREAGAAGKDTRGLLRVHQFDKVELVRFEAPERSREALEEMTRHAEELLEELELPYRRVILAGGDTGFSAAMTYDVEIWAPGVEKWLEVSSCSTCTDYQARRAGIRYRPAPGEKPELVHTLNGSALALPRLVAALLETYQEEDGSVTVPAALRPAFGAERMTPPG